LQTIPWGNLFRNKINYMNSSLCAIGAWSRVFVPKWRRSGVASKWSSTKNACGYSLLMKWSFSSVRILISYWFFPFRWECRQRREDLVKIRTPSCNSPGKIFYNEFYTYVHFAGPRLHSRITAN
jgi:hypothetical protein